MKIIFFDDNQEIQKYETEEQDLKQLFHMADKLSDTELKKLETSITQLPKIAGDKSD